MKKKKPKEYIVGDDGHLEWLCEHGIGHGNHPHSCDGCCLKRKKKDEPKRKRKSSARRNNR